MKEVVNFLVTIYSESIPDIATILNAEAEGDTNTLIKYLETVKSYTEGLINKLQ